MLTFAALCPATSLLLSLVPVRPWRAGWRAVLACALPVGEPEATPELPPSPVAERQATDAADPQQPGTMRIGDYTIGEANCPELYGHPDIRY
jgi:hypothetical protein